MVGATNLLDAAATAGVERVVFVSSVGAMGPAANPEHPRSEAALPARRRRRPRPDFRYARAKALGEQHALQAAADGLDVVVVNPGFVIGPGDVHRVSSWPIEEYLRGVLRFTVRGGLSYVDVRDVVAGMLLAEQRGVSGERYILSNDEGNLPYPEFFERVGARVRPPAGRPTSCRWARSRAVPAGGAGSAAAAGAAGRQRAALQRVLVVLHVRRRRAPSSDSAPGRWTRRWPTPSPGSRATATTDTDSGQWPGPHPLCTRVSAGAMRMVPAPVLSRPVAPPDQVQPPDTEASRHGSRSRHPSRVATVDDASWPSYSWPVTRNVLACECLRAFTISSRSDR